MVIRAGAEFLQQREKKLERKRKSSSKASAAVHRGASGRKERGARGKTGAKKEGGMMDGLHNLTKNSSSFRQLLKGDPSAVEDLKRQATMDTGGMSLLDELKARGKVKASTLNAVQAARDLKPSVRRAKGHHSKHFATVKGIEKTTMYGGGGARRTHCI